MFGSGQAAGFALALNSLPFLAFLALSALVYFVAPARARWLVVVSASVVFYLTWVTPSALLGLLALVLVAHLCALLMVRLPRDRRLLCGLGVAVSVGTLVVLKYGDLLGAGGRWLLDALGAGGGGLLDAGGAGGGGLLDAGGAGGGGLLDAGGAAPGPALVLPVGYSFITFTIVSYVVDVYRGKLEPARLTDLAAFVSFFPKLLAGPIERASHFLPRWRERPAFDSQKAVVGLQLILWGLFKKVVIADRLAPFVNRAYEVPAFSTPLDLLFGTYFYAFQIYCDFSGYTDIAIGAILLFGVALAPNFHHPYLARTVPEFWNRRWHISLGTWFRDYLYIPLGGSRAGRVRTYLNVMTVFVVSGLWHAGMVGSSLTWTFAVWGAINGLYVVAWNVCSSLWKGAKTRAPRLGVLDRWPVVYLLQVLLTFHLVAFSWVFFRASSLADAWTVVTRIYDNLGNLPMLLRFYDLRDYDFVLSLALIVLLLVVEVLTDRRGLMERLLRAPVAVRWGVGYAMAAALLVLGEWGTSTFIYMQF